MLGDVPKDKRRKEQKRNRDPVSEPHTHTHKHTVLLHDAEELDNDLGGGAHHHLALACLLGIVDCVEAIVEDGSANHFEMCRGSRVVVMSRFSMARNGRLRYLWEERKARGRTRRRRHLKH